MYMEIFKKLLQKFYFYVVNAATNIQGRNYSSEETIRGNTVPIIKEHNFGSRTPVTILWVQIISLNDF